MPVQIPNEFRPKERIVASKVMQNFAALAAKFSAAIEYDDLSPTLKARVDAEPESPTIPPPLPTGGYLIVATTTAPAGFLACDGAAVSRSTYAALFAKIGTLYGPGDNVNTFTLPDARGRDLVGVGTATGVGAIGQNEGLAVGSRKRTHRHSASVSVSSAGSAHFHRGADDASPLFSGVVTGPYPVGNVIAHPSFHTNTDSSGEHTHPATATVGDQAGPLDQAPYLTGLVCIKT